MTLTCSTGPGPQVCFAVGAGVGYQLGIDDGLALGDKVSPVGSVDGASVASRVGRELGRLDARRDGPSEGTELGNIEGVSDASPEGLTVGTLEGMQLGWIEGWGLGS